MKTYITLVFYACLFVSGSSLAADSRSTSQPTYTQDVTAIQQLLARYAHALDSGNGNAWAATFVEEGTFETVGRPKIVGRAQIAATINNRNSPPYTARHMAYNTVIDIKGDTATMRAYLVVTRGTTIIVTGGYEDVLRREKGQWLFVSRKFTSDAPPAEQK